MPSRKKRKGIQLSSMCINIQILLVFNSQAVDSNQVQDDESRFITTT